LPASSSLSVGSSSSGGYTSSTSYWDAKHAKLTTRLATSPVVRPSSGTGPGFLDARLFWQQKIDNLQILQLDLPAIYRQAYAKPILDLPEGSN
jgi:hypothetical protein